MLLQTFIQLHILLAATPGLAGWTLFVPATQAVPAHVVYLAVQNSRPSGAAEQASRQRRPVASVTGNPICLPVPAGPVRQDSASCLSKAVSAPGHSPDGSSFFANPPRAP